MSLDEIRKQLQMNGYEIVSKEDIEKIKNWDNLNSGFKEKVDWSKIQFVAVSEHNKENPIISEFSSHQDRLEQEIKQLKEAINESTNNLNFASTKKEEYKQELATLKSKIDSLILNAKNYPYDQTDMYSVIKNLEELLEQKS